MVIIVVLWRVDSRRTNIFWLGEEWYPPSRDIGTFIKVLYFEMDHSLSPSKKVDSAEAALSWPVAVDAVFPAVDSIIHVAHSVVFSQMIDDMILSVERSNHFPGTFAFHIMAAHITTKRRQWNKTELAYGFAGAKSWSRVINTLLAQKTALRPMFVTCFVSFVAGK